MKNILALLTIVAVFYSCRQSSSELTDVERDNIKEEIKKITYSIYESASQKDAIQLYSNFSDKTTGIFSGTVMESWEEHKRHGADFFAGQKQVDYKIDNMTVEVLSSNA